MATQMSNNVHMRQLSKYQWEIVSESGNIIQNNISFSNTYKAEQYVKNYISSFVDWRYTIITLEKVNKQEEAKNDTSDTSKND